MVRWWSVGASRIRGEPDWLQFCQVTPLHRARLSGRLPSGKCRVKTREYTNAAVRQICYIKNSCLCTTDEGYSLKLQLKMAKIAFLTHDSMRSDQISGNSAGGAAVAMGFAGQAVTIMGNRKAAIANQPIASADNVNRQPMPSSNFAYPARPEAPSHVVREEQIEYGFIGTLQHLNYQYRADIGDRASLERNFREKFEALNRVKLSDGEFAGLLDEIVTPDVFTAARTLRSINAFTREDGTPLNHTLVNIKDWCKNTFEVVNQLRVNTDCSHHRYDVLILINVVPCVHTELKTLGISPRRAIKKYLREILHGFINRYPFNPALFSSPPAPNPTLASTPLPIP